MKFQQCEGLYYSLCKIFHSFKSIQRQQKYQGTIVLTNYLIFKGVGTLAEILPVEGIKVKIKPVIFLLLFIHGWVPKATGLLFSINTSPGQSSFASYQYYKNQLTVITIKDRVNRQLLNV